MSFKSECFSNILLAERTYILERRDGHPVPKVSWPLPWEWPRYITCIFINISFSTCPTLHLLDLSLLSACGWQALLLQVPDVWRGRNLKTCKPFIEIKQGTRRGQKVRVEMGREGKKGSQRMLGALCTEWQPCTLFLSVLQPELSKMTAIVIGAFPSGFRCLLILKPHWKFSFLASELSASLIIF